MPIDHGDMFLLSRVEHMTDVSEVLAVSPWSASETEQRLSCLVRLGLLEWVGAERVVVEPAQRTSAPDFYAAITLRPQPKLKSKPVLSALPDFHATATLRPRLSRGVAEFLGESLPPLVALHAADGLRLLNEAAAGQDRGIVGFLMEEVTKVRTQRQLASGTVDSQRPTRPKDGA